MRKADAWQWLDTANFRKSLPAQAHANEWNALYRRTPEDRNTLLDAADFLDEFVMDEDDEADVLAKRLREIAGP